jgi:hypothetical protein
VVFLPISQVVEVEVALLNLLQTTLQQLLQAEGLRLTEEAPLQHQLLSEELWLVVETPRLEVYLRLPLQKQVLRPPKLRFQNHLPHQNPTTVGKAGTTNLHPLPFLLNNSKILLLVQLLQNLVDLDLLLVVLLLLLLHQRKKPHLVSLLFLHSLVSLFFLSFSFIHLMINNFL